MCLYSSGEFKNCHRDLKIKGMENTRSDDIVSYLEKLAGYK